MGREAISRDGRGARLALTCPSSAVAHGIEHVVNGSFFPGSLVGIPSHSVIADALGAAVAAAVSQSGPTRTMIISASSSTASERN